MPSNYLKGNDFHGLIFRKFISNDLLKVHRPGTYSYLKIIFGPGVYDKYTT